MFRFLLMFLGLTFTLLGFVLTGIYVLAVAGVIMGDPFPGIKGTPIEIVIRFLASVFMMTFGVFCLIGPEKEK